MTKHYTFAVGENDYAPPSDRYQATIDDFDLDCKTGSGPTPEEAIMDYIALWDLPKTANEIREKTRDKLGE